MSDIPLPKSRSGWLAGLLLTIIVFALYYLVVYDKISDYYRGLFLEPHATSWNGWDINIRIPQYNAAASPGWIYGSIRNTLAVERTVAISVEFSGEDMVLIPSMYRSEADQSAVFTRLASITVPAGGTSYWRLRFGGGNNISTQCEPIIKVDGTEMDFHEAIPCPASSSLGALGRSAIEIFLLPPWSNTFIPVLVLFLCFMVDNEKDTDFWRSFGRVSGLAGGWVMIVGGALSLLFGWPGGWILSAAGGLILYVISRAFRFKSHVVRLT
jgi:hypothetical protein